MPGLDLLDTSSTPTPDVPTETSPDRQETKLLWLRISASELQINEHLNSY